MSSSSDARSRTRRRRPDRRPDRPREQRPERNGAPRPERNGAPRPQQPKATPAGNGFTEIGVAEEIAAVLAGQGITEPRPIQAETIAAGLAGRDVCGRAPTGSGKTLAFCLPLAHMNRSRGKPIAMVLAPTRELALQIAEVLEPLAAHKGLRVRTLIGGTKIDRDIKALRQGTDIVVGCPGRMVDLANRNALVLRHVRTAVLDEADRMADMGFIPDVTRLLDATDCADGQLLLFSATLDDTTAKLERRYQSDPVRVDVGAAVKATGNVSHTWHVVPRQERRPITEKLLADSRSAIVFTRTKRGADRLAKQLSRGGLKAAPIHGDRSQSQRQRALNDFTDGRVGVLVATDIAARGIHVDDVDVVLHYDLPATAEDYTHRSGRTGRAGADGTVHAVVCDDSRADARTLAKDLTVDLGWVGDKNGPNTAPPKQPGNGGGGRGGNGRNGGGRNGGGRNGGGNGGGNTNGGGNSSRRRRNGNGQASGGQRSGRNQSRRG